jgi:hypothetical protein
MSGKGRPRDNAQAESFKRTLKREEIYLQDYQSFSEANKPSDTSSTLSTTRNDCIRRWATVHRVRTTLGREPYFLSVCLREGRTPVWSGAGANAWLPKADYHEQAPASTARDSPAEMFASISQSAVCERLARHVFIASAYVKIAATDPGIRIALAETASLTCSVSNQAGRLRASAASSSRAPSARPQHRRRLRSESGIQRRCYEGDERGLRK